jgi:hypothetical protein
MNVDILEQGILTATAKRGTKCWSLPVSVAPVPIRNFNEVCTIYFNTEEKSNPRITSWRMERLRYLPPGKHLISKDISNYTVGSWCESPGRVEIAGYSGLTAGSR